MNGQGRGSVLGKNDLRGQGNRGTQQKEVDDELKSVDKLHWTLGERGRLKQRNDFHPRNDRPKQQNGGNQQPAMGSYPTQWNGC